MSWVAKPTAQGGYPITSVGGTQNILEIASILSSEGWSDEAIAGCIANSVYEGGLNPWRWGGDTYPPAAGLNGCGLFGFTPYTKYLNYPGSDQMNMATSTITANASPDVGAQQVRLMSSGTWGWIGYCWRSGRNYERWTQDYVPDLYNKHLYILNRYGNGSYLSISDYSQISNVEDATFAFFACFEGPSDPTDYYDRKAIAPKIFSIIAGYEPEPGGGEGEGGEGGGGEGGEGGQDTPEPTPTTTHKGLPIYMMIRKHFRKE